MATGKGKQPRRLTRAEIARLAEEGGYEVIFWDQLDDAIIGLVTRFGLPQPVVAYDYRRCIEALKKGGLSHDAAVEYFDFNIMGAWVGEATPCFLVDVVA